MKENKRRYYEDTFGKEDPLLHEIRKQASSQNIEQMQLSPADACLLQFLTRLSRAEKAIEIGGLFGYSTLHIARGLHSSGCVYSLDIDSQRQEISQKLIKDDPNFSKIKWIAGDAHKTLQTLTHLSPFDLIFIDAEKSGYGDYLKWSETHLKVGGLLVADNTFLFDTLFTEEPQLSQLRKEHGVSVQSEKVLKQFNERITSSKIWKSAMIPTIDGLSVAFKVEEGSL